MAGDTSTHEDLSRTQAAENSSDRAFGFVFSVVFGIVSLWPLLDGDDIRYWAAAMSVCFLVIAVVMPKILAPLNRVWMLVGLVLHKVTNPVVMGLLFFFVLTPTGFLMRLSGKDPMNLKFDSDAESYWILRDHKESDSMSNQF